MNVVHFISSIGSNGVSSVVLRLSSEMAKQGHTVTIVTSTSISNTNIRIPDNVRIVNMNSSSNLNSNSVGISLVRKIGKFFSGRLLYLFKIRDGFSAKFVQTTKSLGSIDKVYVHCLPGKILLSSLEGVSVSYVIHNSKSKHLNGKFFWQSYLDKYIFKTSLSDKELIAVSESVKNDLISRFDIPQDNIKVILNPFDFNNISELSRRFIPKIDDYYLLVGRLSPQKRFDKAIVLLSQLLKKGYDLKFIVIGEGKEENKLKALASNLGIEDKIIFLGHQSNPYPYFLRANGFLLTSDFEGLPTVIIESLILNCKVMTTPVEGCNEILGESYPYISGSFEQKELLSCAERFLNKGEVLDLDLTKFRSDVVVKQYLSLVSK